MPDWEGAPVADLAAVMHLRPGISMLTVRHVIRRALSAPPSAVAVRDVEDVMSWLRANCEYISDARATGTSEHWMPPDEFERVRRGDCEDHALWAWRRCLDLRLPTRIAWGPLRRQMHAWVQIHERPFTILETTAKDEGGFVRDPEGLFEYHTEISVDGAGTFYRHAA
jgi:hypothetical protein